MLSNLFKATRTKAVSELREVFVSLFRPHLEPVPTSGHHRGNLSQGVARLEGRARTLSWKKVLGGRPMQKVHDQGANLQRTFGAAGTEVGCSLCVLTELEIHGGLTGQGFFSLQITRPRSTLMAFSRGPTSLQS